SRYFMSQICCEIEATTAISVLSLTQSGDVSVYHSSGARLHLQAFCRRAGDRIGGMLAQGSYFVPYTQAVKSRGAKISPDLQLRLLRSRSAHSHLRTAVYGRVPTWMTSPIRSTTRISMPGRRNRRNCCAAAGPAQTVSISSTLPRRSRIWESELHACQSLCEHIIEHLLKLEYAGLAEPARHWQREIVEWRLQLEKKLTRSILTKLDLVERYRSALRLLRSFEVDAPGLMQRVPAECPYSLD